MKNKSVCVIGLGYIGLPTAAILATHGFNVSGVDIDPTVVEKLNKGEVHIEEKALQSLFDYARLKCNLNILSTPIICDVYIICVPTPFSFQESGNHVPNLDYVRSAFASITKFLKAGDLIILESTVPIGTLDQQVKLMQDDGIRTDDLFIAYCPERVMPGDTLREMIDNDRLVGGINKASAMAVGDFYGSFVKGKVVLTNAKTAEFSKLAENSYRDVNIAFANELSIIADRQGVDVCELIKLANLHPRVNILQPGPGVGGHCIAVDPWFIVSSDLENSKLIRTAREVNNSKKDWVLNKIELEAIELEKKLGRKPTISFMGITYKPNIDDLRESPSLAIVKDIDINYKVLVVDPYIEIDTSLNIVNFDIAFQQADLIVVLVKHDFFCCEEILMKLSKKITLDFCGLTNKANMQMN